MSDSRRLFELLQELNSELRAQDTPERQAYASLLPNSTGWTEQPYTSEAFEFWEGRFKQCPEDLTAVHRLAIMYHARAFDLEQSEEPDRADGDWRRALDLWYRLWKEDQFWEDMAKLLDEGEQDPFSEVRNRWAARLLALHFAIALDPESKHYRARFHVKLALESGFPREIKNQVREEAYRGEVDRIPSKIWDETCLDTELLEEGITAIKRYLDVDESHTGAHRDLLSLVVRRQTSVVQEINAADTPQVREEKLGQIRSLVEEYQPYVDWLEERSEGLEMETLSELRLWHFLAGQAYTEAEAYDAAAGHYRCAMRAADRGGADGYGRFQVRKEWLLAVVRAARKEAASGDSGKERARELLAEIESENPLPAICLMVRAQSWLILGDLGRAERDGLAALRAIERDKESPDFALAREAAELEPHCRELLEQMQVQKAVAAMEGERWDEALDILDHVLAINPENVVALLQRAVCYLKRLDVEKARVDLDHAEGIAKRTRNAGAGQACKKLRGECEEIERTARDYGGLEAFRLQQKAARAFNADRFEDAAELLRRALGVARSGKDKKLKQELSVCLGILGVRTVNEALAGQGPGAVPNLFLVRRGLSDAETLLEEAVKLDPANKKARGDLEQVRMLKRALGF